VLAVAAIAQLSSFIVGTAILVAIGQSLPSGAPLAYALAAGGFGAFGLLALYRALAIGIMSIAAPISALAAVVPFAWGIASGDRPQALQLVGAGIAMLGAVLAAREPSRAPVSSDRFRQSVGLALFSAVALGLGLVMLGKASSEGAVPVIVADRIATAGLIVPLALLRRQMPRPSVGSWWAPAMVGVFDTGANVLFVLAFQAGGLMAIIGLLASLYPVTTVLLARFVLSERLERHQTLGIATALAGVALVSVG
jgi:drug/metabolite transporter (DMT)-like permease